MVWLPEAFKDIVMRSSLGVLAVVMGLGAACSHEQVRPGAGDSFVVHVHGGSVLEAKVTDSGVVGPEVRLNRSGSSLRGEAFNRPVDVQWSGDEVTGLIGRTPVQLTVHREGNEIHARGLYEGRLSDLRVSRSEIEGPIGNCSYSLKASESGYQGFRSCTQSPESPTTVQVPGTLWQQPDTEQVALLALLLAH